MEKTTNIESLHDPDKCPCRKKKCERYKKCDECAAYHYGKGGRPACER
jgi:hypothetical protein